jgi:ABC-type lipoprotein export system ATPase subunit
MSTPTALAFDGVAKRYRSFASGSRYALHDVSFVIPEGTTIAVVGRSGSGKSTLLHLAAGIDVPTAGRIEAFGRDLGTLPEHDRTLYRRDDVGLVFQFFHLLPHLAVWENVALPEMIAGSRSTDFRPRIRTLLERVGLADRERDQTRKLSGGEMQRVAICRALVRAPRLVLADEPTGNLDDATGAQVMDLILELVREEGGTLVYVTHSRDMAARADAVWELRSGTLVTG